VRQVNTLLGGAVRLVEVLKATIVHAVRHDTGRSSLGFVSALFRPLALLALFYVMIEFGGMRGLSIRGSTVTFLLTGIFCFLVHIGTIQKVSMALRKSRGMLYHAPASIFVFVLSQAFGALYLHFFGMLTIVAIATLAGVPLDIRDPAGLLVPYLLSWASGLGMGMIFMALGHAAPTTATVVSTVYTRVQFFTSGKFWAANMMPALMPAFVADWAIWNPLLHVIDQTRGAAFVNYVPRYTNLVYPAVFTFVVLVFGFALEAWVRRRFSLSRGKGG
jgi:ABC-type polysaccharide/polyol phosphate export permease